MTSITPLFQSYRLIGNLISILQSQYLSQDLIKNEVELNPGPGNYEIQNSFVENKAPSYFIGKKYDIKPLE